MTVYSRSNPSPRYQAMLALYREMHEQGDKRYGIPPAEMFSGLSIHPHVGAITYLLQQYRCESMIDYGCGKAEGYTEPLIPLPDGRQAKGLREYWQPVKIALYDPGVPGFDKIPSAPADAVISTDVLEHIPEEDIPWILDEIFSLAKRIVFLTIACYPARKMLPTGENAHITLRSPGWWLDRIDEAAAASARAQFVATIYMPGKRRLIFQSKPPEPA